MKKIIVFCFCLAAPVLFLAAMPGSEKTVPLRVGIMPDADSLPFMYARDFGFFENEGVKVELVTFSSPQERDAAIQAGRLDGAVSDLLAAAFLASGGFDFKITSLTDGRYGIVASPDSGIRTLGQLRGKRIGLSLNSIIQYTVDAQLEAAGVSMDEYTAVPVPRMPLRLELLLSGQIDAASLPEPLLTAAAARGGIMLSTTDKTGIDAGVLLFSGVALRERLEELRAFYRAYYGAAARINGSPDSCRNYLIEQASFPAAVKDTYDFVTYRSPRLPEHSQITRALDWLKARGLLDVTPDPASLTDPGAISEW